MGISSRNHALLIVDEYQPQMFYSPDWLVGIPLIQSSATSFETQVTGVPQWLECLFHGKSYGKSYGNPMKILWFHRWFGASPCLGNHHIILKCLRIMGIMTSSPTMFQPSPAHHPSPRRSEESEGSRSRCSQQETMKSQTNHECGGSLFLGFTMFYHVFPHC
jgi:hypothetical protein